MDSAWAQLYGKAYQARHEAGHAAGYVAQAIALSYVTIVGHGSQPRPHTQPKDLNDGTYGQRVLAYTSGVIAGFESNDWYLTDRGITQLLCDAGAKTFELATSEGRLQLLEREGLVVAADGDLARIGPEHSVEPFAPEAAIAFWRSCERFVLTARPGVEAVAAALFIHGRLEGDEARRTYNEGMRGRPEAWLPPWTLTEM